MLPTAASPLRSPWLAVAGFYVCFGCCAFVPAAYWQPTAVVVPVGAAAVTPLHPYAAIACLVIGCICLGALTSADMQKVRRDPCYRALSSLLLLLLSLSLLFVLLLISLLLLLFLLLLLLVAVAASVTVSVGRCLAPHVTAAVAVAVPVSGVAAREPAQAPRVVGAAL
jgi:hypothetical protein